MLAYVPWVRHPTPPGYGGLHPGCGSLHPWVWQPTTPGYGGLHPGPGALYPGSGSLQPLAMAAYTLGLAAYTLSLAAYNLRVWLPTPLDLRFPTVKQPFPSWIPLSFDPLDTTPLKLTVQLVPCQL
jgi:hypothetical protein